jgi:hypothetical protein
VSKHQTLGLVFDFEESPGDPLKNGPTRALIYLQTYVTIQHQGFPGPIHTLAPAEHGPDAFDAHADRLIENIQRLKKEARAKFEEARRRRHEPQ